MSQEQKKTYVGSANIKTGNDGGQFGNIRIELNQLCNALGIDLLAFKKLIAKDFDNKTSQFNVPHLHSWSSEKSSGVTLKLKFGTKKQPGKFDNAWIALDDYVPGVAQSIIDNQPEDLPEDSLPF